LGGSAVYCNHGNDGGCTTTSRYGRHQGSYGDLGWYSSGAMSVTRTFYYNANAKRTQTSLWTPRTGVEVCKYGRTSGATCDTVFRLNNTLNGASGLVATHRSKLSGGDSGGPWYYGGIAFGISSGYDTITLIRRDLFTPARNLGSALDVTVYF
jgi:hypothetical protein